MSMIMIVTKHWTTAVSSTNVSTMVNARSAARLATIYNAQAVLIVGTGADQLLSLKMWELALRTQPLTKTVVSL